MARRNLGLDVELNPEAYDEDAPVRVEHLPPAPPAPVTVTPDFVTLVQALAEAMKVSTAAAITETKDKPRSREDHEYERVSNFNPKGDRDHPRPDMICPTFLAVINEDDPSQPPTPYIEFAKSTMTYDELVAINSLPELSTTVELNDGSKELFTVYVKKDPVSGRAVRKLLSFRKRCYEKDKRNSVPNVRQLWRQVQDQAQAV